MAHLYRGFDEWESGGFFNRQRAGPPIQVSGSLIYKSAVCLGFVIRVTPFFPGSFLLSFRYRMARLIVIGRKTNKDTQNETICSFCNCSASLRL